MLSNAELDECWEDLSEDELRAERDARWDLADGVEEDARRRLAVALLDLNVAAGGEPPSPDCIRCLANQVVEAYEATSVAGVVWDGLSDGPFVALHDLGVFD